VLGQILRESARGDANRVTLNCAFGLVEGRSPPHCGVAHHPWLKVNKE